MKNLLLILALIVSLILSPACLLKAQTPEWLWAKGSEGPFNENITRITESDDGSIVVLGNYNGEFMIENVTVAPLESFLGDAILAKFNAAGELLWHQTTGGAGFFNGAMQSVATDSEGNIYVAGSISTWSPPGDIDFNIAGLSFTIPIESSADAYIAKLDPDGNGIWIKNFSTSEVIAFVNDINVVVDEFDRIYMSIGFMQNIEIDGQLFTDWGQGDLLLSAMDADGNFLYTHQFGGNEYEQFSRIQSAPGGGIIMSGDWSSDVINVGDLSLINPSTTIDFLRERWIAKINMDGTTEWLVLEGGPNDDGLGQIVATSDGGAMNLSYYYEPFVFNETNYDSTGYLLTRYNSNGVLESIKYFPSALNYYDYHLSKDANTYFLSLSFNQPEFTLDAFTIANSGGINGSGDGLIAAINENGDVLWAIGMGSTEEDVIISTRPSQSGALLACGNFQSPTLSLGETLLENDGTLTYNFFFGSLNLTTAIANSSSVKPLSIFPNPVHSNVTIDLNEINQKQLMVRFIDQKGSLVYEQSINGGSNQTIDVSALKTGIYAITIVSEGSVYATEMLKH